MQLGAHGPRPTVEAVVHVNSRVAVAARWLIETRRTAEASSSSGLSCQIYLQGLKQNVCRYLSKMQ